MNQEKDTAELQYEIPFKGSAVKSCILQHLSF